MQSVGDVQLYCGARDNVVSGRDLKNRICDNGIVEHTAVGVFILIFHLQR